MRQAETSTILHTFPHSKFGVPKIVDDADRRTERTRFGPKRNSDLLPMTHDLHLHKPPTAPSTPQLTNNTLTTMHDAQRPR